MSRERVLIIEVAGDVLGEVRSKLQEEGFDVYAAASGEAALSRADEVCPDLIILERQLPGLDGLAVCRILRSRPATRRTPILMVAPAGGDVDALCCLEHGADDFVGGSANPEVVLARARAVLRRHRAYAPNDRAPVKVHELAIDPTGFIARIAGHRLDLTVTEFRLLHFLARHPGWAFGRYQLVDAVKGEDAMVSDRAVDGHVLGVRRKLGAYGHYIETVRGVGYRFKP